MRCFYAGDGFYVLACELRQVRAGSYKIGHTGLHHIKICLASSDDVTQLCVETRFEPFQHDDHRQCRTQRQCRQRAAHWVELKLA